MGYHWLRLIDSQGGFEILSAISVLAQIFPSALCLLSSHDRLCCVIRRGEALKHEWIVRLS